MTCATEEANAIAAQPAIWHEPPASAVTGAPKRAVSAPPTGPQALAATASVP